jgi:hypothetical protein
MQTCNNVNKNYSSPLATIKNHSCELVSFVLVMPGLKQAPRNGHGLGAGLKFNTASQNGVRVLMIDNGLGRIVESMALHHSPQKSQIKNCSAVITVHVANPPAPRQPTSSW